MSVAMFRRRVDPRTLAGREATLEGELPVKSLPRLAAMLSGGMHDDFVRVRMNFHAGAKKLVLIGGNIDARLTLQCQRCLEPVSVPVRSEFRLALSDMPGEEEIPRGFEPLEEVGEGIVPADIVEEELLLALPFAATHASPSDCGELASRVSEAKPAATSKHPFAVLKNMKLD